MLYLSLELLNPLGLPPMMLLLFRVGNGILVKDLGLPHLELPYDIDQALTLATSWKHHVFVSFL